MSVATANWASSGGKITVHILVRATMRAAVVVVRVCIVLPSMLLVMFPSIFDNVCDDSGNIVVIGDGEGIICGSAGKDFFGVGGEGILIWL